MEDEKPSSFADLLTGAAWLALAAAIIAGAWRMDRLAHLGATLYTVPGLVPGLLGAAIGLMAIMLMLRGIRAGALAEARAPRLDIRAHWRLIATLGLGLVFAIGLVGHGLPFWLAAAVFIAAFVFVFQFEERRRNGTVARGLAFALLFGAVSGLAIHYIFQDVFLVRVP
jgi:hypothetical protein